MSVMTFGENSRRAPGTYFWWKITILPIDHYGGHKVGPVVFILCKNIAKCNNMPYGRRSAEFRN
jgi:hypothetical protein